VVILNLFEIILWKGCFARPAGFMVAASWTRLHCLVCEPLTANHPECQ
jgi:hypothetical protein